MSRVWLITKLKRLLVNRKHRPTRGSSGFSVVEVLLAATVFAFLMTALVGATVYGRAGTAAAGDREQAITLADEGIEAVRNIRDSAYSNLPSIDGTYYLGQSGGVWTIGSTPEPAIGIFTRQITVATVDSTRKSITSTVSWTTGSVARQVSSATRMTNWRASIASGGGPGPIMMAYSKTTNTPYYRLWTGSAWGAESSAGTVGGNINYIVLKSSRTRNENILGTQDSTGAIYVQIWDGVSWGNKTQVGTGSTTTRSFDIAYEKNGDRAIIVYTPTAASADFDYRIWNGTTLSSATTVTAPPTTGAINWIELDQNPLSSSNEVALILLDANIDVYGMVWTGSTWSTMGTAAVWDASASTVSKKAIDVEYEQTSGEALFMWGDSVATDQYYRTWNGTTLSAATLLDISDEGGVAEWVQLAARPSSNEIMIGIQDAGGDLNTRVWSGSAWDTSTQHLEHDATVENVASRNFDIVWETHASNSGKAWLMWGDQATVSTQLWTSGAPTPWGSASVLSGSDDTSFVRLRADPVSGAVFAGIYEDPASATDDIWDSHLTGGSATWSAKGTIWGGPTTATSSAVFFRIDIATP